MLDENDHRHLGQRLDLFHFQEEAPGMVFWHPRGLVLYRLLENRVRELLKLDEYQEVRTPQILSQVIWESSGHWQNFRGDMLILSDDKPSFALKPVSCPGHIEIVRRKAPSYRDLPIRLSEFGLVHRNERSGSLQGLFRLRQFTQDDGHIFCSSEQVGEEVARFCRSLHAFYAGFGFHDVEIAFSSRPPQRAGHDQAWDLAERMLEAAAREAGLDLHLQPGQGAFYGPKLEFSLKDRLGRSWQCGTIQLDFVLPERFDLHYVESGGDRKRPAMLHRALFGSLERFLGILLEQCQGALPPWLAPQQAVLASVGSADEYAQMVMARLSAAGIRSRMDRRSESLARKIVEAHEAGIPFFLVVGKRERAQGSLRIRDRAGNQHENPLDEAVRDLVRACSSPRDFPSPPGRGSG